MPQVFKVGSYWIYFWSNENNPREPVHVHVSKGSPRDNSTKIWITSYGKCLIENNNSHIPGNVLKNIVRVIEARSDEIVKKWELVFGEIRYYC